MFYLPNSKIVVVIIMVMVLAGYTWHRGMRGREAKSAEAARLTGAAAKDAALSNPLAQPTPTPHPLSGNEIEVREIDRYLSYGMTLEQWRTDAFDHAKAIKAEAARLKKAHSKPDIERRIRSSAQLLNILEAERKLLIWQGGKTYNMWTRNKYRHSILLKDREIEAAQQQIMKDSLKLGRFELVR